MWNKTTHTCSWRENKSMMSKFFNRIVIIFYIFYGCSFYSRYNWDPIDTEMGNRIKLPERIGEWVRTFIRDSWVNSLLKYRNSWASRRRSCRSPTLHSTREDGSKEEGRKEGMLYFTVRYSRMLTVISVDLSATDSVSLSLSSPSLVCVWHHCKHPHPQAFPISHLEFYRLILALLKTNLIKISLLFSLYSSQK